MRIGFESVFWGFGLNFLLRKAKKSKNIQNKKWRISADF